MQCYAANLAMMEPASFDLALAQRLARPGPRYTSYPTAAHFHGGFSHAQHAQALREAGAAGRPLSLYVHIPFCEHLCYYCACHMQVTQRPEKVERYVGYLLREVDRVRGWMGMPGEVVQVHWGGGTPNSLSPGQIRRVAKHLQAAFPHRRDAEMSIECDPRTTTREHLAAAAEAGFRRLSLGVQTFDPIVQRAIGRVQSREQVARLVAWAAAAGFEGISFDLLYGLPSQDASSLCETVSAVVALAPHRVALFGYAHVPWLKRHQRMIDARALPSAAERLRQYALAHDLLVAAGYRPVGLDHFARAGDPLLQALEQGTLQRNFQGYSTHAGADVIGFGASSISAFGRAYAQNLKRLPDYYAALDAGRLPTERGVALSADDALRREIITRVMCGLGIDKRAVEARAGIHFDRYFAEELIGLEEMQELGLVRILPHAIEIRPRARPFVRNIAMVFDRYLREETAGQRYSQTV